jgi:hypothetical protein
MFLALAVGSQALAMEASTTAILLVRARVEYSCTVSTLREPMLVGCSCAVTYGGRTAGRCGAGLATQQPVVIVSRNGVTTFEF